MKIKKIINYDQIEKVLKKHKNKKIVQCHGVFDLLHIGHLRHFENAKKIGDILIVSLTADQYIEKGFNRPFFKNQHRLESLSLIENIDYVVLNNSKSAVNIISKIKPDFYCKGQDYKNLNDDITGEIKNEIREVKKNGGKIVFTNDITFSSSSILNNIASQFGDYQNKFINSIKKKTLLKI